jgi:hypothetical protein
MLAGIAATIAGPSRGIARWIALALTIAGGVLAATAKPGYAVVLVPVLILCFVASPAKSRIVGLLFALLVGFGAAVPITAAIKFQDEEYGAINTHNLVFTGIGPASGGDALDQLHLPPDTLRALGTAFYPGGGSSVPNWQSVVGSDWSSLRAGSLRYTLSHPRTAFHMIKGALLATSDPRVSYLPENLRSDPNAQSIPIPIHPVGEQGADGEELDPWLASRPLGSLPFLLLGAAAIASVTAATRRRSGTANSALGVVWVTAAVLMGLLAIVAVMGDGFFEIAKHTWLAAYCGAVSITTIAFWGVFRLTESLQARALSCSRPPGRSYGRVGGHQETMTARNEGPAIS